MKLLELKTSSFISLPSFFLLAFVFPLLPPRPLCDPCFTTAVSRFTYSGVYKFSKQGTIQWA